MTAFTSGGFHNADRVVHTVPPAGGLYSSVLYGPLQVLGQLRLIWLGKALLYSNPDIGFASHIAMACHDIPPALPGGFNSQEDNLASDRLTWERRDWLPTPSVLVVLLSNTQPGHSNRHDGYQI